MDHRCVCAGAAAASALRAVLCCRSRPSTSTMSGNPPTHAQLAGQIVADALRRVQTLEHGDGAHGARQGSPMQAHAGGKVGVDGPR